MAAVVGVTFAFAACTGTADRAGAPSATSAAGSASTTAPLPETSTSVPQPTTTTSIPLYSFDGSVPPPTLVNTGDDFDAIFRSIDAYSTWLLAHSVDLDRVKDIAVFGSAQYRAYEDDIRGLRESNLRLYDEGPTITDLRVVDRVANVVTLRLVYSTDRRVVVDANGQTIDEKAFPATPLVALLESDSSGSWRLVSIEPATIPDVEVAT